MQYPALASATPRARLRLFAGGMASGPALPRGNPPAFPRRLLAITGILRIRSAPDIAIGSVEKCCSMPPCGSKTSGAFPSVRVRDVMRGMKIDPAALYQQLGELTASMPGSNSDWQSLEAKQWLGRASVLVEASNAGIDAIAFTVASDSIGTVLHVQSMQRMSNILYRALARAELAAPASAQGRFIPVGESFSALSAIAKVLTSAKGRALIVDP